MRSRYNPGRPGVSHNLEQGWGEAYVCQLRVLFVFFCNIPGIRMDFCTVN